MKRSLIISVLVFSVSLLTGSTTLAQSQQHEMGLRLSGIDNFGFIYKKAIAENKFRRYRLGIADFLFTKEERRQAIRFDMSFAIGTEKRLNITDELMFIHGFEPRINFGYSSRETNTIVMEFNASLGLGYVLGFQYDFSEQFYVNIETIPFFSVRYLNRVREIEDDRESDSSYTLGAGFNANFISASLVYRFSTVLPKNSSAG